MKGFFAMDFMELLKVIFLGVVEGITEWLPVSSTGHMLLVDRFMPLGMSVDFKEMFFVVIQLGAILAVVVVFWPRLWPFQEKRPLLRRDVLSLWSKVAVGCVPAGVLGLLLDDFLEAHFGTPLTIAAMLIVYGIAFILVEIRNEARTPVVESLSELGYGTAVIIGFFQALAMIPGTSRSGATIIGGLLLGVSRTAASEFSFFLAIPTMLGASALKLMKFGLVFTARELICLMVGMVVAFAVSIGSVRFLMGYVRRHDFKIFGRYRIALGAAVIALTLLG